MNFKQAANFTRKLNWHLVWLFKAIIVFKNLHEQSIFIGNILDIQKLLCVFAAINEF